MRVPIALPALTIVSLLLFSIMIGVQGPLAVILIFISLIRNVEHIFIYWLFCAVCLSLLLILFFYCVVHLLLI